MLGELQIKKIEDWGSPLQAASSVWMVHSARVPAHGGVQPGYWMSLFIVFIFIFIGFLFKGYRKKLILRIASNSKKVCKVRSSRQSELRTPQHILLLLLLDLPPALLWHNVIKCNIMRWIVWKCAAPTSTNLFKSHSKIEINIKAICAAKILNAKL